MKRNKDTNKQSRTRKRSTYAEKKARGQQMYGPGCCGHTFKSVAQQYQRQS